MNGNWYPWAGANNGGANGGPAKYIAAYRHVHDLFVADGATNVYWVWCPLVADVPAEAWNHWTNYYPGDAYVDWVGLDAYNWGNSSSCCTWQSFTELVTDLYNDYAGKKPIILPETVVGRGRRQQGGVDRRSAAAAQDALHRASKRSSGSTSTKRPIGASLRRRRRWPPTRRWRSIPSSIRNSGGEHETGISWVGRVWWDWRACWRRRALRGRGRRCSRRSW